MSTVAGLRVLIEALESGRVTKAQLLTILYYLANLIEQNDISSVINEYDEAGTYDTPGAGNGNPAYALLNNRLWKSKVDANTGNTPPTDTEITENDYWIEVSKGTSNLFQEWQPGVYGEGLIIVFYNDVFYKLTVAERPFESTNIETEYNSDPELSSWKKLAGDGVVTGEEFTTAYKAMLDLITITQEVDLDQVEVDVNTNATDIGLLEARADNIENELPGKKPLADEAANLDFAAGTAYNFSDKQTAYFDAAPIGNLTPVFSGVGNLRSAIGEISFSGLLTTNCEITLSSSWFAGTLPDEVTFESNVLTFTAPTSTSLYVWYIMKKGSEYKFNIQKFKD
ncbi:hypothetical protein [Roseivirga thermotolerans]|uniref:Uncharacterized protein n=1 Tax=Roseivirga thermotolerans TaxID=1758176 RepID=A0ABQ3IA31_9BACT|nr:hypothetical protein [Roseivirga thermotolerans]GHE64868.1 hypothetical protein GCM10011340_19840 [Roseivirga thermotolerans]